MQLINRREFTKLINELGYKRGAEIGVREGHFSKYIVENTNIEKWYSIDPWENNPELPNAEVALESAKNMFEPFGERIEMIKGYSPQAADLIEDNSLDFIYIDGMHTYDEVKADINAWWSKLKDGGILAGHDYHLEDWPGVYDSVNEFVEENNLKLNITGTEAPDYQLEHDGWKSSWWFFKSDYWTVKDINGNGLNKIGNNRYQSTTTGNIYIYDGDKLNLIAE